jgi:SAM-dependent methyltransferase
MDLRGAIRRGRKRGAWWAAIFDLVRPALSAEGRSLIWLRLVGGSEVHQTTAYTEPDRYPELMALAAKVHPGPSRILSFGCSTGEELVALRGYFPKAQIVGAEINARSRRIAARLVATDGDASVVAPDEIAGSFGVIFALAVLQREPHKVAEMGLGDLSGHYPFDRFEEAVSDLVGRLEPGGLLCVTNAHYPVEAASAASLLDAVQDSPRMEPPLFGADGRRLSHPAAHTIFRKRASETV